MRGFAAIGLLRPKHPNNIGGAMRAAHCYKAQLIVVQGERARITDRMDTPQAYRHTPVIRTDDIFAACPYDAVPIAVDIVPGATQLQSFQHPPRAFYIFGPEDGTLPQYITDRCQRAIVIPTRGCMNLAATVNVVLYDRMAKALRMSRGERIPEFAT